MCDGKIYRSKIMKEKEHFDDTLMSNARLTIITGLLFSNL